MQRTHLDAGPPLTGERWPFVARDREVEAVLRTVTGSQTGGAMLVGPAGIGKTRLAEEVLELAARQGYRVLRVHASEAARDVNLGAFAGLLPSSVRASEHSSGPVVSALQSLASGTGRAVLLVDDVDLLDPVSAVVVHQIVANRMLDVLATIRAGVGTPEFVAALARTGRLSRVDLEPLRAADIADLVTTALAGPVSSITISYVQRVSAGNPLYVRELISGALEVRSLSVVDGLWHLRQSPVAAPRLVDLLDGRLRSTTPDERRALELLAIAGHLGLSQLHDLSDQEAVEALERRGLVSVRADGRRMRVNLAHPLYGEILRTTMPGSARVRHSRALAQAWEASGTRRRDDLIKWAVWRLDGGGPADPALVTEAARQATLQRSGVAVRERLARHAWQTTGSVSAAILLCVAQFDAGTFADGYATLDELAARVDSDEARASVALTRAFYLGWGAGRLDEALALLQEAEAAVSAGAWRAELAAQRGMLLAASGAPTAALELLEPLPEGPGAALPIRACAAAGMAYMLAGRFPQALRLTRAAYTHAAESDGLQPDTGVMAGLAGLCLRVITDAGHAVEARHFGGVALQSAARSGDAHGLAWITAGLASLELPAGNLDEARRYALEAAAYFRQVNSPIGLGWVLAVALLVAVHQGDAGRAATIAAELAQTRPEQRQIQLYHYEIDRAVAWHATLSGDALAAAQGLAKRAWYWHGRGAVMPAVVICGDLARLGRAELAAEVLAVCPVPAGWPLGEAIAAFVTAAANDDARGLEGASARFSQLGYLLYAADAMAAAAAAWQASGGASARESNRVAAAAAALAARCPGLHTPLLARSESGKRLTTREREIALLAAQGMSNRDIASRLTVSGRTVENHLAHVYLKLGVHSRDSLAAWFGAGMDDNA